MQHIKPEDFELQKLCKKVSLSNEAKIATFLFFNLQICISHIVSSKDTINTCTKNQAYFYIWKIPILTTIEPQKSQFFIFSF